MTGTDQSAEEEIARRLESVQSRYHIYRGAEFRAVIQYQEGRTDCDWVNILGSFRLSDASGQFGVTRFQQLAENLQLAVVQADPASLTTFLTEIVRTGRYVVGEAPWQKEVTLNAPAGAGFRFGKVQFHGRDEFEWRYNESWGGLVYFLNTNNPLGQLHLSEQRLESQGFRQLKQLLWHHVLNPGGEFPESPQMESTTGIYVVIPNYHARLAGAVLEGRTAKVDVETARGVPLRDFRVVLTAYGTSAAKIGWNAFQPPRIWERLNRHRVEYTYPSAPHSISARLFWNPATNDAERFVDERRGERAELVLYPQLAVHDHFDPELKALMGALGTEDQSEDFEWAIATLLTISGFQVHWLGYNIKRGRKLHGEIDIVAYEPTERLVILAECTLRGADIDRKISALAEKAADLASALEGWKLKKALFTTLSWAAIQPGQKQGSKALDIVLLTRENLPNLVQAVQSAIPAEMLWDRLKPNADYPPRLLD